MPLPDHALILYGGCACRSIRYKITIPPLSSRPLHPNYDKASFKPPVYLPYTFTCHCNDCRSGSSSILPAFICPAMDQVQGSYISSEEGMAPRTDGHEVDSQRRPWLPASEVFMHDAAKNREPPPLSLYESSLGSFRNFCSRCGSSLTYMARDMPGMIDIVMGTVDREFLEMEALMPERHLWWELGMDWVKRLVMQEDGGKGERHRTDDMNDRLTWY